MLHHNKARLLLALLVLTGLAGRNVDHSLSTTERTRALNELKQTRNLLLESVEHLSAKQLQYENEEGISINKCLAAQAKLEQQSWDQLALMMKQDNDQGKKTTMATSLLHAETAARVEMSLKTISSDSHNPAALSNFQAERQQGIKYIRKSTEDFKDRVMITPRGEMNGYGFVLLIGNQTRELVEQVQSIRQEPGFPKQ